MPCDGVRPRRDHASLRDRFVRGDERFAPQQRYVPRPMPQQDAMHPEHRQRYVPRPDPRPMPPGSGAGSMPAFSPAPVSGMPAPQDPPANRLATWPEWNARFRQLGLRPDEIAAIAAAPLSQAELAGLYDELRGEREVATGPATTLRAWPQIEAQLRELGATDAGVKLVGEQQMTQWQLENLIREYRENNTDLSKLGQARPGEDGAAAGQVVSTLPGWPQSEAQLRELGATDEDIKLIGDAHMNQWQLDNMVREYREGNRDLSKLGQAKNPAGDAAGAGDTTPGWSDEFQKRFAALGVPEQYTAAYQQSNLTAAQLDTVLDNVEQRIRDIDARGFKKRLEAADVSPDKLWQMLFNSAAPTDEVLERMVEDAEKAKRRSERSVLGSGAQLATSLIPGGRLAQYVAGEEFVSGDKIRRRVNTDDLGTDPLQLLGGIAEFIAAAASGLALFGVLRGAPRVFAASKLRTAGFQGLKTAGLRTEGQDVSQKAFGAVANWNTWQKIQAWIPGTRVQRDLMGLAHADAGARALLKDGAWNTIKSGGDGDLMTRSLAAMIDDIKSGEQRIRQNVMYPWFHHADSMSYSARKGAAMIKVASNVGLGDGRMQAAGLAAAAGQRMIQDPSWKPAGAAMAQRVANLAQAERAALPRTMEASVVNSLGVGTDGLLMARTVRARAAVPTPEYYTRMFDPRFAHTTPAAPGGGAGPARAAGAAPTGDAVSQPAQPASVEPFVSATIADST